MDTYAKLHPEKMRENSRKLYWNNDDYRKFKRLNSAYKRYLNGSRVNRDLITQLNNHGYKDTNGDDLEFRTHY